MYSAQNRQAKLPGRQEVAYIASAVPALAK